jgi:hypothetical protein
MEHIGPNKGSVKLEHIPMNAKETRNSYNDFLKPLFDFVSEKEEDVCSAFRQCTRTHK